QALLEANSTTALGAWNKQRDAVRELADSTEPTVDGMKALTSATGGLYQSTVQLLAGILSLKDAIHATLQATRESIETSLLSPKQLYERYEKQNSDLYARLATATDPAEIKDITDRLNANIGKM